MCVQAITAAGNIKSGSDCRPSIDYTIAVAASPSSQAYFFYEGSGSWQSWAGRAGT